LELEKRPIIPSNVSEISLLYVVSAGRPAAELNAVDSGMAGEFGGMISHLIFDIVIGN
jgi:hypothetical protein